MEKIEIRIDKNGQGAFYIQKEDQQIAEMVFKLEGKELLVFHTEVIPEYEGNGLAKQLLDTMVEYVRRNELKVVPLCPYVLLQFKRHPDLYNDLWIKNPI